MRTDAYADVVGQVIGTPGIRGALVVDVPDGLIVDGRVHVGVHGEAVAALAASLYRRAFAAARTADEGPVRFVEVEGSRGRILISGTEELVLMAVVEERANPGQVRLAVRRAAEDLAAKEGSV